jgi:hypothetical protein
VASHRACRAACCVSRATQFPCFTGTKVQILTHRRAACCGRQAVVAFACGAFSRATQFTCFTGTIVQILTHRRAPCCVQHACSRATQFTCFTGTKVQILTRRMLWATSWWRLRAALLAACASSRSPHATTGTHSLYWYKDTCLTGTKVQILAFACGAFSSVRILAFATRDDRYSVALLVPKRTCFTGTKVQILAVVCVSSRLVLSLLALLVQKYKY